MALTDEKGLRVCLSLDRASAACGKGYKAVKNGDEFVCRKKKLNLRCPKEFVLSFTGVTPACVREMGLKLFILIKRSLPDSSVLSD